MGFEIIDIRRFEPKEFSSLLESESRAWHDNLRWDFSTSSRVINACLRDKRLSGYALVGEQGIRGYCFFFYDGEKGIVGDLFVDSDLAGQGHEGRLLEHSLETLLGTPGLHRIEAQLPHYQREEVESYFLARGFQTYLRHFMSLLLRKPRPTLAAPHPLSSGRKPWIEEKIEIIPWDKHFHDEAAELLYESYRQHVDGAINDQYTSVVGATRLIENIYHNQGCGDFLHRVSRMAVHRPTRQLAGILTVTNVSARVAHIPQVGVGPLYQGLGVGTTLMEMGFEDLLQEGYEQVTLTVTHANGGAHRLYERLGFESFKEFGAFTYNRP